MECHCSDRNNQLSGGFLTNKDGNRLQLGEFKVTPDKRVGEYGISPTNVFMNDALLGAPAFDGMPSGEPQVFGADDSAE